MRISWWCSVSLHSVSKVRMSFTHISRSVSPPLIMNKQKKRQQSVWPCNRLFPPILWLSQRNIEPMQREWAVFHFVYQWPLMHRIYNPLPSKRWLQYRMWTRLLPPHTFHRSDQWWFHCILQFQSFVCECSIQWIIRLDIAGERLLRIWNLPRCLLYAVYSLLSEQYTIYDQMICVHFDSRSRSTVHLTPLTPKIVISRVLCEREGFETLPLSVLSMLTSMLWIWERFVYFVFYRLTVCGAQPPSGHVHRTHFWF